MNKLDLSVKLGIVVGLGLIAFFLILSLFNLHTKPIFSLFNSVIVGLGVFASIRHNKLKKRVHFSYSGGFSTGIASGFIATLIFTFFFLFYATEVDALFMLKLLQPYGNSYSFSVGLVTFTVAVMGFATTVVLTLAYMQLFKISRNIPQTA